MKKIESMASFQEVLSMVCIHWVIPLLCFYLTQLTILRVLLEKFQTLLLNFL